MKENKTLLTIGLVFFVGAVTRIILKYTGGVRSLPYIGQIIIMLLIPTMLFMVIKREKRKMNNFQYELAKLFLIFFSVMAGIMCAIIVLCNGFPNIWKYSRIIFEIMTLAIFILFSICIIIVTLRNIKNIR